LARKRGGALVSQKEFVYSVKLRFGSMETHSKAMSRRKHIVGAMTSILGFIFNPMLCIGQSKVPATVHKQVVEQMIRSREIQRACLQEVGTYDELVFADYENYNDDRVPEVIVVQKAGCISPGSLPFIWIYRKTSTGYRKIYGPVSGDALKQNTKTNGYYDVVAVERAGRDRYESTTYRFDGIRYRKDYVPRRN
jgi:hypothetical protein